MTHPLAIEAQKKLTRILDDHPDATVLMIAIGHSEGVDALSVPSALCVKRGLISDLFAKVCGIDE